LLVEGDRVLLCQRGPDRAVCPNCWDIPRGHLEPGELPPAALQRELHEELGIEVEAAGASLLRVISEREFELSVWHLRSWVGDLTNVAPEEHDRLGWFSLRQASELEMADCAISISLPMRSGRLSSMRVR
jgi:8-oxo-dGTP diphosphatase